MLYTVNYTKKNGFMRHSGKPRLIHKDVEQNLVTDKEYVKPTMPKAMRVYVPPVSYKKRKYLINLSQKELDELVKEIGFYDENGKVIEEAPLRNLNAPFWKHKDLKLVLEDHGTVLNDDIPLDRFWLRCFEVDPRFRFADEQLSPSKLSKVQYTVVKFKDKYNEISKDLDVTYNAIKLLGAMENDLDKMVDILRAMGTNIRDKSNPKLIRQALYRKITEYKDIFVPGTSETNLETFIKLAKNTDNRKLMIKSLITQALSKGLIAKKKNKYFYGDLQLGTSKAAVEQYLNDSENEMVLTELMEKIK